MLAEVEVDMAKADGARQDAAREAASDSASGRLSLFAGVADFAGSSGCSTESLDRGPSTCLAETARVLLTSVFLPSSNAWDTRDERLTLLPASRHQHATPSSLCDATFFASHDRFELPDHAAPARPQPPGLSSSNSPPTTSVHRFCLSQQLREALLPALGGVALQQRRDDPVGVQVSNVGGWHGPEQLLDERAAESHGGTHGGTHGGSRHWYAEVHSTLLAALSHLSQPSHLPAAGAADGAAARVSPTSERVADTCIEASSGVGGQRISGWLNSSGPHAFNALHDHGSDVEWSLVLFVAAGETAAEGPSTASLGGSLLLKTQLPQLGPLALQHHGFLPVPPVPGDLWAFPGYMPHCVMPRATRGPGDLPVPPMTRVEDESRQRVSAAFNVYSSVSVDALSFVEENRASVLLARDQALVAMEALRAGRARG